MTIREPIHSGNITQVSYEAITGLAISDAKIPTVEEIIDQLRASFKKKKQAKNDELDRILKEVSEIHVNYEIVPVYWKKISSEDNSPTIQEFEYGKKTGFEFMKKLGTEFVDELKAAGLCEFAIKRMEKGLTPFTEEGYRYHISLDHTLERALAGDISRVSAIDENAPPHLGEILKINHVNNIKMIDRDVEEDCKNALNKLQGLCHAQTDAEGWGVMVVRKAIENASDLIDLPENGVRKIRTTKKLSPGYLLDEVASINYLTDVFGRTAESIIEGGKVDALSEAFNKNSVKASSLEQLATEIKDVETQLAFAFNKFVEFDVNDAETKLDRKNSKYAKNTAREVLEQIVDDIKQNSYIKNIKDSDIKNIQVGPEVSGLLETADSIKEYFVNSAEIDAIVEQRVPDKKLAQVSPA